MTKKLIYENHLTDNEWGCDYYEVTGNSILKKIKVCHVKVSKIQKIAEELARSVQDTSWMMRLDKGTQRAYDKTAHKTAQGLVEIFQNTIDSSTVGSEFGEIMVSIGSTKALELFFEHQILPVAELWKPQTKQNEGFDFHTVCKSELINFGEAKYSSNINPHGNAIAQAKGFLDEEKHLRDRVHLVNLVSDAAINKLDDDSFGIVASFSLNAVDPLLVLANAVNTAQKELSSDNIKSIYLVGVSH